MNRADLEEALAGILSDVEKLDVVDELITMGEQLDVHEFLTTLQGQCGSGFVVDDAMSIGGLSDATMDLDAVSELDATASVVLADGTQQHNANDTVQACGWRRLVIVHGLGR